jgi:hypothetical protein
MSSIALPISIRMKDLDAFPSYSALLASTSPQGIFMLSDGMNSFKDHEN